LETEAGSRRIDGALVSHVTRMLSITELLEQFMASHLRILRVVYNPLHDDDGLPTQSKLYSNGKSLRVSRIRRPLLGQIQAFFLDYRVVFSRAFSLVVDRLLIVERHLRQDGTLKLADDSAPANTDHKS